MTIYVVIDTNVLVSSLLREQSLPGQIIKLVISNIIVPVYSNDMIKEYKEVLSRDKFNFDYNAQCEALSVIIDYGIFVIPKSSPFLFIDQSDKVFYETLLAIEEDSKFLITGNKKHYPDIKEIMSPREFIEHLFSLPKEDA